MYLYVSVWHLKSCNDSLFAASVSYMTLNWISEMADYKKKMLKWYYNPAEVKRNKQSHIKCFEATPQ